MWQQIEFALHQSIARVLTKVATLLPAVLALVLAVLIAGLAVWCWRLESGGCSMHSTLTKTCGVDIRQEGWDGHSPRARRMWCRELCSGAAF